MFKIEMSRAFNNKFFFLSIIIGSIITVSHLFQYVIPYARTLDQYVALNKPMMFPGELFSSWLGGNSYNMQAFLYYLLIPILATIPFADSFFLDKKKGFIKNVLIRTNRSNYYISKFIVTFIVGGCAVLLPLLLNFGVASLLLPSMLPQPTSGFDFLNASSMWSNLYFSHPFIYVFSYMTIDFVFSGVVATIALAISFYVEHRFVVVISPFLLYLFTFSLFNLLGTVELEAINFLQPSFGNSSFVIILIETLLIVFSTAIIFFAKGIKDDTY
jgi:hypothetical protein